MEYKHYCTRKISIYNNSILVSAGDIIGATGSWEFFFGAIEFCILTVTATFYIAPAVPTQVTNNFDVRTTNMLSIFYVNTVYCLVNIKNTIQQRREDDISQNITSSIYRDVKKKFGDSFTQKPQLTMLNEIPSRHGNFCHVYLEPQ